MPHTFCTHCNAETPEGSGEVHKHWCPFAGCASGEIPLVTRPRKNKLLVEHQEKTEFEILKSDEGNSK